MHILYYCMDVILVIGTCEDFLAFASHSELMSKFPDSVWATLVLWVQKDFLRSGWNSTLLSINFVQVCAFLFW